MLHYMGHILTIVLPWRSETAVILLQMNMCLWQIWHNICDPQSGQQTGGTTHYCRNYSFGNWVTQWKCATIYSRGTYFTGVYNGPVVYTGCSTHSCCNEIIVILFLSHLFLSHFYLILNIFIKLIRLFTLLEILLIS